jgi:Na+/H+ antiporter NhaD/arsenite permease-like protein
VPDYSEFPTTPTGWQERAWQEIAPLETEAPPPPRRRAVDLVALIPGVFFVVLAVAVMAGVSMPFFFGGGVLWLVLIGAGAALLVSELRKARARR